MVGLPLMRCRGYLHFLAYLGGVMSCIVINAVFGPFDHFSNARLWNTTENGHLHVQTTSTNAAVPVRLFCLVLTTKDRHKSHAKHILNTWGRRCDKIFFMSDTDDKSLPILKIDVPVGRKYLVDKIITAYNYTYAHHINDFDWFLKADDDTYVIVENLRYFLSEENPDALIHFGHHFKKYNQSYFSGGPGYVLSRGALRQYVTRPPNVCPGGSLDFNEIVGEDIYMGRCLEKLGVVLGNSLDRLGRTRFNVYNASIQIKGKYPEWYPLQNWININVSTKGVESISDYAISFHYITPDELYNLEFYVYHLRPYGIEREPQQLNRPKQTELLSRTKK